MDIRKILSLSGLILLTVFLLAVVWEFAVEDLIEDTTTQILDTFVESSTRIVNG